MSRNYEALIVLESQGQADGVDEMVSKIGQEMEGEGAKLGQVDHLGVKKFPHAPKGVTGGYYINIHFTSEPAAIDKIQAKLDLDTNIYQHQFKRLG